MFASCVPAAADNGEEKELPDEIGELMSTPFGEHSGKHAFEIVRKLGEGEQSALSAARADDCFVVMQVLMRPRIWPSIRSRARRSC